MRWSIGRKIGSGFGLALVVLTVVGGVSYDSTVKLIGSAEWVRHTHEVLNGLDEVTSEDEIRPAPVPVDEPDADVFELTDDMAVPNVAPPRTSFHKIEPQDDLEFTESAASRAINRRSPTYALPIGGRYRPRLISCSAFGSTTNSTTWT